MMVRPLQVLLYFLLLGLLAMCLASVWPKGGVPVLPGLQIQFASLDELLHKDGNEPAVNVDQLLKSYEGVYDSVAIKDSLQLAELAYRKQMLAIQFADSSMSLPNFFSALRNKQKVRILHYGDSQIEGDRISSYLRNALQTQFGGVGPGYVCLTPLVPGFTIQNERSGNWRRYPIFGNTDSTMPHNRFGMYAVMSRFTPYPAVDTIWSDSLFTDSLREAFDYQLIKKIPVDTSVAWVKLQPTDLSYRRTRRFDRMELLFSNPEGPFELEVMDSDSNRIFKTFAPSGLAQSYVHNFPVQTMGVRLSFRARTSPEFFGIRLEGQTGVVVDNIAMRGSAGNYFGGIAHADLAAQMQDADADLILLQFGGNTVPYMNSTARAEKYGQSMGRQIRYLRKLNPGADILLIGPSDMATKVKTEYVTFPYLTAVRDALKKVAFDNGCGFWDMYEVMGGRNSMREWVNADPPLAASDYVHFAPRGASKMAKLFFDALMDAYDKYQELKIRTEDEEVQ